MADENDVSDLYERFADFLHENEGGEDALREWRRKQAVAAKRNREPERRRQVREDGQ